MQVHQMINHSDRAEINRMESRCGGLFESPGVSLPDAYHSCLICRCFSFLCFSPLLLFHSLAFSPSLYLLCETRHLAAFFIVKVGRALVPALDAVMCMWKPKSGLLSLLRYKIILYLRSHVFSIVIG